MSLTYTAETYESGPLSTTTEYKLSDGSRWVRIVEEYIAPDMKSRRRTRVLRSDFPGDSEHRDTLTNLQGAIANADVIMYANPSAPTSAAQERLLAEEAEQRAAIEAHRAAPEAPAIPATRDEKREAAIARAKAENAARPAYVMEPGFEEQALPMTARQEAVVTALHRELVLHSPLDVLPPTKDDACLTASATDPSRTHFAVDVDPEGYLDRVAVRYEVAGKIGWATLGNNDPVRDTLLLIARAARLATPALTAGTNAAE